MKILGFFLIINIVYSADISEPKTISSDSEQYVEALESINLAPKFVGCSIPLMRREVSFEHRSRAFLDGNDLKKCYIGQGAEGIVYAIPESQLAIKKQIHLSIEKSVSGLLFFANELESNFPELKKFLDVVKVYEMGDDWIVRDFSPNGISPKKATSQSKEVLAFFREFSGVVKELYKNHKDNMFLKALDRRVKKMSNNLLWDDGCKKFILIDAI